MRRWMATLPFALLLSACASAGPPPPPPPPDPSGVYDCTITVDGQEIFATMTVEKAETGFTGVIDSDMGSAPMMDLVVQGKEMTFAVDPGGMLVYFRVTFEPDSLAGGLQAEGMTGTISGKKR